eukprot:TRINITY_DN1595_c0_g1_i1.p1 TRINITY_DN1595_c0_g1~~TRINITY_DN1595_c0_g1_i1.p1  ORF type:complete len:702 (+),score=238.56 TRINITY_DN1595_c0_g1_i1:83-2188(+)
MKIASMIAFCAHLIALLHVSPVVSVKLTSTRAGMEANKAIAEIVTKLKEMAEKSKEDGEKEADTFGKYDCHNKKVISNKSAWIETMTDEIETAKLSMEQNDAKEAECKSKVAQMDSDIADNEEAQKEAVAMREKSHTAFLAEEADMKNALKELGAAWAAFNKSSGGSLLQLPDLQSPAMLAIVQRLRAVSKATHSAFLAPQANRETGAVLLDVGSQGDGVAGILKSTQDSYAENLKDLQDQETSDQTAHNKTTTKMQDKKTQLKNMREAAKQCIEQTAQELVTQRKLVTGTSEVMEAQKKSKAQLEQVLSEKTKVYEDRKLLRTQEDAAISKAISILNSDDAYASFNKVSSSFLQLAASAKSELEEQRMQVLSYLRTQAELSRSTRLAQLAVLVSGEDPENPFTKIFAEIHDMKAVIDKEKESDEKKRDTCAKERKENDEEIKEQSSIITNQNTEITKAKKTLGSLEDKTGLLNDLDGEKGSKAQLQASLLEQKDTTQERAAENQDYQQDVADLQVAQDLIKKAMKVLKDYYAKISLVQQEDGSAGLAEPTYDEGKFAGQSASGDSVIKLMQTMLDNTAKAEAKAHQDEKTAQASYEDSMKTATDSEAKLEKQIMSQKEDIAETHLALDESKTALADAKNQKASAEKYLSDIKKDCDFIVSNFDKRDANRQGEKKALDSAIELIKGTPAYKTFEKEAALRR